jgi:hypothetical protein
MYNMETMERTPETTTRLERLCAALAAEPVETLSLDDAKWITELAVFQCTVIDTLRDKQADYAKLIPVAASARSLMVDLGRGNKDVSFSLAEMHNSLRILDGKDYLSTKPGIILA